MPGLMPIVHGKDNANSIGVLQKFASYVMGGVAYIRDSVAVIYYRDPLAFRY
jgi:hypothetical protein